jgi:hypothetical protein
MINYLRFDNFFQDIKNREGALARIGKLLRYPTGSLGSNDFLSINAVDGSIL